MNLFKKYTYTWWQIGIFKLSLLSIGVTIGVYWKDVFEPYLGMIVAIAAVTTLYIISVSLRQTRK